MSTNTKLTIHKSLLLSFWTYKKAKLRESAKSSISRINSSNPVFSDGSPTIILPLFPMILIRPCFVPFFNNLSQNYLVLQLKPSLFQFPAPTTCSVAKYYFNLQLSRNEIGIAVQICIFCNHFR